MSEDTITLSSSIAQAVFDIATESMDFTSGFLDDEEQDALVELAIALGIDPMRAVQHTHRCKRRAKAAGVDKPIHSWSSWVVGTFPVRRQRFCNDCHLRDAEGQLSDVATRDLEELVLIAKKCGTVPSGEVVAELERRKAAR